MEWMLIGRLVLAIIGNFRGASWANTIEKDIERELT